jgi:hypothetical protein
MKPSDVLNAERFPLTTQKGLSVKQQLLIDAVNLDALREQMESGPPLDAEQQARLAELEEKEPFKAEIMAALREEEKAAASGEPG